MDDVLLFGFIIFALVIAIIVIVAVWDLKKNMKKYDEEAKEYEEKKFSEEANVITRHAEIVDMLCGTGMVGSYRLPKSEKTFLIIFRDDEGGTTELAVGEEVYLSLEVGMKGMLTILEGHLDSFELDEEEGE